MRNNPRRPGSQPVLAALTGFAVAVIPVVALAVSCAFYLRQLGRYLAPRLAPLVAQVAADSLNREVRIDRISVFDRPGAVILDGVSVSNGRTFKSDHGLAVARVPQATITYDLPRLMSDPADAVTAIRSVDLVRPSLYAEQLAPGKFNFSTLIKPPSLKKPFPFRGTVFVHDATLVVRDYNAPKILGVQQNAFAHVNATADLTTPGRVAFQGTAAGNANRFATVRMRGSVVDPARNAPSNAVRGFSLRVQVARGNVPYLTNYFAPFLMKTVRLGPGVGDADLTVAQYGTTKPGPFTVLGSVNVRHGFASLADRRVLRRSLEDVNARLTFTTTDLAIAGETTVSGVPVTVNGAILDFAHPRLALSIESSDVTYAGLKDALSFMPALPNGLAITASGTAVTWVTGDLSNPRVEASADLPSLSYSGTVLTAIHGQADFQDGVLRVDRLQATAPATKGSLDFGGFVKTQAKPLVYDIAGNAVNVNLAGIPLSAAVKRQVGAVQGVGSAQFQASNLGIQADVAVTRASVHRIGFDDVSGRLTWSPGRAVILHRLVAHLAGGGVVYADGRLPVGVNGSGWNLSVQAAQVGLGRLVRPFAKLPIGGELYLFGTLHGPGAIPELTGKVSVLVPHYGNFVADQLRGTFSATADGAQIERVVIQRFPGTAVIAGTVTHLSSGNPTLNLQVAVTGAQLSDLTRLAAQHPVPRSAARAIAVSSPTLTGDLAAELGVTGTAAKPRVAGQITLSDATYSTFELDHASADVVYAADIVSVSRLTATGTGFQLQGTGSYGLQTHRVAAQLSSSINDIGQFVPASDSTFALAGPVAVNVAVGGTTEMPIATAHLMGQGISVAGVALDSVSLAARYERGTLTNAEDGLAVIAGAARYLIPDFRYDPKTTGFALTGEVTGETVRHLLTLARSAHLAPGRGNTALLSFLARVPQNADGRIALPLVQASGTLKNPAAHVVLTAKDIVYGAERLDTITADARYADAAFDVASLEVRGKPNAYLSASGHVDPNGSVNARLEASGIDLAPLNSFLPLKKPIGGQIGDLTVVASGQTRAPVLTASVTLERPSYGTFFVDGLDSGRISVMDSRIAIDGLQIVKDEKTTSGQVIEHFASLRGSLPFAWEPGAALTPTFPQDVPIDLQVSLPPQSLSSIPALFPGVPLKFPSGTVSANIGLGGTLAKKQITGSLIVADGAVQSKQLTTSLRDVNINVALAGDQARINTFTADSTAGGSVQITGGATLTTGVATDTTKLADELVGGVRLNLTAAATDFSVDEPKITQFGNAGFRGKVNGMVRMTQALRSPLVVGDVTLSSVVGVLPSLSETAGVAASVPLIDPQFRLGVAVARGSRLRSSLLDAQTDGALTVRGTLSQPDIAGDFTIRQGRFYFPTATFRVVPVGTVHLAYMPPDDPVERINLTARTQISVSDATIAANPAGIGGGPGAYVAPRAGTAAQTSRNYTVTVTIQGLLNSPDHLNLNFQSDPPGLTQTQILATLGGQQALAGLTQGNAAQALKTGVSQVFTSFAVPLALQPVETGIANGLGLEDFSIAYSPEAPVQLTFVKRLTPRIGLTYIQMVNSRSTGAVASTLEPPVFQVKLDYSFTDRFRLSLSTDDQRNTIVGLERVYSF